MQKGASIYIASCNTVPNHFKIGMTKDIKGRMRNYHTSFPGEEKVEYHRYVKNTPNELDVYTRQTMILVEKCIHLFLDKYRMPKGPNDKKAKEWFIGDLEIFKREVDAVINFFEMRELKNDVSSKDLIHNNSEHGLIHEDVRSTDNVYISNNNGMQCLGCHIESYRLNDRGMCDCCSDILCKICDQYYLPCDVNENDICYLCNTIQV